MNGSGVVLGAGSGLGEAVARQLSTSGRRLVLGDIDVAAVERVASELAGDIDVCRCDITSLDDLEAVVERAGDVASLVVTAGLSPTMASGRRIFEVDLVGPALVVDAFSSSVGPGSAGLILASIAGHMAPAASEADVVLARPLEHTFLEDLAAAGVDVHDPGTAYMYSKRGVLLLVRREAAAWGQRGARLLSLSPGIVDTPMGRREQATQPMIGEMLAASPLGRLIRADEVAAVASFLVSEEASAVTGTDVLVDGGTMSALGV